MSSRNGGTINFATSHTAVQGKALHADKLRHYPMTAPCIVVRPIAELRPHKRNARKHPPAQISALAESIKRFGFNSPVMLDERGTIIAGHGRVEAAKRAGLSEVPTITLAGLSQLEIRAYMLADNRVSELASWDRAMLLEELDGLGMESVGFLQFDMSSLDEIVHEELDSRVIDANAAPQDDAEIEQESKPEEKRERNVFPLVLTLNRAQWDRWQALKKAADMGDTELFVSRLMGA